MIPQSQHQYIIFFGDSFSASMSHLDWLESDRSEFQSNFDDRLCHPSIVTEHYRLKLLNFSYSGKSWWYSREKFFSKLKKDPKLIEKTFAIIFFHTSWNRHNCEHDWVTVGISSEHGADFHSSDLVTAEKMYIKYFYDDKFQTWAGEQWFREIFQNFKQIPTIHFHCFPWTVEKNNLLPGKKFTTPLVHIQISEMSGTDKEIDYYMGFGDKRANHFNNHNNQALANVIIEGLKDYHEGTFAIDLSKFDIPNKNGVNWPNSGFGTK